MVLRGHRSGDRLIGPSKKTKDGADSHRDIYFIRTGDLHADLADGDGERAGRRAGGIRDSPVAGTGAHRDWPHRRGHHQAGDHAVSVLGASLSWILLSVETMYAAARDGVMPRWLAKVNSKGTPVNTLLLTQCFTQVFLLAILSPQLNRTYLAAITIGTTLVLIPYLLSSLYAVKIAIRDRATERTGRNLVIALLGTAYSLYVIYAVGIEYLFLSVLFYGIGSLLYIQAKREKKERPNRGSGPYYCITNRRGMDSRALRALPVERVAKCGSKPGGIAALDKRVGVAGDHIGGLEEERVVLGAKQVLYPKFVSERALLSGHAGIG